MKNIYLKLIFKLVICSCLVFYFLISVPVVSADQPNLDLQVPIFGYTKATNIAEYIGKIFEYALFLIVPIAIVMIMWGGFMWVFSGAYPPAIKTAKTYITSAILGLVLAALSYAILSFIGLTTLNLPGLQTIKGEEIPEFDLKELEFDASDTSGQTTSASSGEFGANPYQAICDQYPARGYKGYREDIGLKCKALGNNAPPGMKIVPMGKYGAGGGLFASEAGLAAFIKAAECVKSTTGHTITGSGWRSAAAQYTTFKTKDPGWAANPCCSNHGTGAAFDVRIDGGRVGTWANSDQILKKCFNAAGLKAEIKGGKVSEPWHFSPSGH